MLGEVFRFYRKTAAAIVARAAAVRGIKMLAKVL